MGEAGENRRLPGGRDRIAESPGAQLMLMLPGNWGTRLLAARVFMLMVPSGSCLILWSLVGGAALEG